MARSKFYPTTHAEMPGRRLLSVNEFVIWAGISRWMFYELRKQKAIRPRKVGSRTVIPIEEAERWLSELPESGSDQGQSE